MECEDVEELLFFDTFSHDASEEINLDLVQFPKPVIISEIRIIPLGARVQADFPGGVRLGATNPSQFHIEFFVNDLSKHGASTFESLGGLEYRQTSDIHCDCSQKKIPTDGLVLRGWYTTITLAVYGTLSKGVPVPLPDPRAGELSASAATAEWVQSQQAAIYRDPGYSYPPDFPPTAAEHSYVESWPTPPSQRATVLGHSDHYDAAIPPNWEHPPPDELKPWVPKEELGKVASPMQSSGGDSSGKGKTRHRGEYWEEREDRRRLDEEPKRFKDVDSIGPKDDERRRDRDRSPERAWRDSSETRSRGSKAHLEAAWDRDRERSPYSENGGFRHRPKSPSSRSPKRPVTPTERFWSPDRRDFHSPSGRHRSSPRPASPPKGLRTEQLLRVDVQGSPQTPLQSPVAPARSLDEEQFEPILSDEDIVDESDSQYPDLDYDFADDLEDVVKPFSPFTFQMQPLENLPDPSYTTCETLRRKGGDSEALDSVRRLVADVTLEVHEDWIVAVEQLPTLLPRALSCAAPDAVLTNQLLHWVEHGLDLDAALGHLAPGAKLRHVKAGVRLAEAMCHCGLAEALVCSKALHERLLRLFHREHMALSIRLLILQALDASLLDAAPMGHLLNHRWELEVSDEIVLGTTYQHLLRMLEAKQQVRIKFAITSLLQKVHTEEVLTRLEDTGCKLLSGECPSDSEVVVCIQSLQRQFHCAVTLLTQPRRFLPVISQFEVRIDPKPAYLYLYRCFRRHKLLETLLVLLTSRQCGLPVQAAVCQLLRELTKLRHGLLFFSAFPATASAILRALQAAEDLNEPSNGASLALELPFRLYTIISLDKLLLGTNEAEVFNILHDLFCVTFTAAGKFQVASTLAQEDSMKILLQLSDHFENKSVVRSYVGDLAELSLRYSDSVEFLRKFGGTLLELSVSEVSTKLAEVAPWIRPFVDGLLDDVAGLCELLKKHTVMEHSGVFPGELITCVRALRALCIPPNISLPEALENRVPYAELRYKHAALQLYSLDGLAFLTAILSKMLQYYEQPFVHSASLTGSQGSNLISFIEPAVLLVRRMLTYLIEARGAEYKDVTHVAILVDVYALMKAVPISSEAHTNAQSICRNVVETLLAYTEPSAQVEVYAKSLWSLMLSDVFKFILKAPYCFLPGFELLSELLPLPLPLQTRIPLSDDETMELRSSRQLWSAHLHPLAGPLHDLFAALAGGSFPPLLQLMRRVAVQLADVAAPTALVIARAVLDPLLATLSRPDGGWDVPAPPHAARLLHFLACLVPHSAIKMAVLSLITLGANARTDERLLTLVDALTHILCTPGGTQAHTQAQECVLLVLQALLDADVTLVPLSGSPPALASALPARDLLATMTASLLDHVSSPDHPMTCLLLALKPLILLTDHDYGFYRLKVALESRRETICNLLSRLSNELSREHTDALNALHGTLALLREFVLDAPTPMRTLTMTPDELGRVLRWGQPDHPLLKIHECLREWCATDESLNNLCDSAGDLVKLLASSDPDAAPVLSKEEEPVLPAALPLIEQFSGRPVFVVGEPDIKTLSSSYWLSLPLPDDLDQDGDQAQCDLIELSGAFLPDCHLQHEVQRVCRLKSIEEDEKKTENSKYQLTGLRTRRPFVAPMRGRGGRPTQQRGDLFRSRPPNTSRPPSLHVDDFVALETCGQQPTGPTGYNKVSVRNVKEVIGCRVRGRGRVFGASPYPRRESPRPGARGRGAWSHEELRAPPSRFRAWQTEDLRRIHPFPR